MLIHGGSVSNSKLEHECQLKYGPLHTEATTHATPLHYFDASYTAQTLRLLLDKLELKFREKIHNFSNSDTLPSATFVVITSYRTVTYLDQRLPVEIAVISLNCSDEITAEPDIKIKSTYMFRTWAGLKTNTSGSVERERTLFPNNDMQVPVPYTRETDSPSPSLSPARNEKTLLEAGADVVPGSSLASSTITVQLDLGSLTPQGWFRTPILPPTFKTPNTAVYHCLMIKMRLDCASRQFDFERIIQLKVLPPRAQGDARNSTIRQSNSTNPAFSQQADTSGTAVCPSSLEALAVSASFEVEHVDLCRGAAAAVHKTSLPGHRGSRDGEAGSSADI